MKHIKTPLVLFSLLTLGLATAPVAFAQDSEGETYNSPRDAARITVQERNDWPVALNLNAYYNAIDKSPEGIESHRQDMFWVQSQVKEMQLEECQVTITFDRPISVQELGDLVVDNDLEGRLLYAFVDDGIETSTLAVSLEARSFEGGLQLAQEFEQTDPNWQGVISLVATIPGEKLEELQNDERVWLVDPVADRNVVWNESHSQYMQHFGWFVYHQKKAAGLL